MKRCTVCRENKPLSDFYVHRGVPRSPCKECKRASVRARNERNRTRADLDEVRAEVKTKRCPRCEKTKPTKTAFCRNSSSPDGWAGYCKACHKAYRYRARYGLSRSDMTIMHEAQEGRCRICEEPKELCVDHDHETGAVRGLLCHQCNRALGGFRDSIEILRSAILYLETTP